MHPYDDAAVIAGQGTVALELLEDHPELDALVVPTGGGGLLAGMAVVAPRAAPELTIIGAQSDRWAVDAGRHHRRRPSRSAARRSPRASPCRWPARITQALVRELVDEIVTVQDTSVEEAMNLLLEIEKVVVEGAGAAGIAALLEHPDRLRDRAGRRGAQRRQRRSAPAGLGDHARPGPLRPPHPPAHRDPRRPGTLGLVTTTVGQAGGNIVEIEHQRMFLDVSARSAELEVVVETIDHDHVERVIAALGRRRPRRPGRQRGLRTPLT